MDLLHLAIRSARTVAFVSLATAAVPGTAATLTFDDLISGATSYGFDGDADGIDDVVFTTTDPGGFNTVGPGLNQSYIHEPGLEGTSLLPQDLRADFLNKASGSISFGFALDSSVANSSYFANVKIYGVGGTLLGEQTVAGAFTATSGGQSSFPEGQVSLSFAGEASYMVFDFTSEYGRYIIDDLSLIHI